MIRSDSIQVEKLVEASRLYYLHHFSQQQVAEKLGVSRPSVSRLLTEARERGIVRIKVVDPSGRGTCLERDLKKRFKLKKVIVVPSDHADDTGLKKRLGVAAGNYLDQIIRDGITLGVSWGSTMQELVRSLHPKRVKAMRIVQILGGISQTAYETHANEVVQKMGENFYTNPHLLLAPAVVQTETVKKALMSDAHIAEVVEMGRQAEMALFSLGVFDHEAIAVQANYITHEEVDSLRQKGAIGDICTRIIDREGQIVSPELNARTTGIELQNLKSKQYSIAVAGGLRKLDVIRAGLLGHYFNVLITDEDVASALLDSEGCR